MHNCPTCGEPTPEGSFCVRCGAPQDQQLSRSRERPGFAAAPHQSRYAPWLVSSLFPHLPRHSERHFHLALGAGIVLVVALGAGRLSPVALIVAALLMPLLTVLYLYDASVYRRDPAWAYAATLIWGTAAGVGLGFLARADVAGAGSLIDRGSTAHVLVGAVAVPALGVIVTIVGLVILLRRRTFAEVLDGTTFAAATGAALAASEAVVVGIGVLTGGLRPPGAAAPWIARLVAIAIATPVLSMGALATVGAALWLRYRSPMRDRRALGPLGHPAAAFALAVVLAIAGASGETFLPAGAWLAWLVALDLVALVLLRRALHVGLLEEAADKQIGPSLRCANCEALTPAHTFCANCGISLSALPKPPPTEEAAVPEERRGSFAGRLAAERHGARSNHRRLVASGVCLSGILAVAVATGALAASPGRSARCKPGVPCGKPPIPLPSLPRYVEWRSSDLGFALRYNDRSWSVKSQAPDALVLQYYGDSLSSVTVSGVPSTRASASALLSTRLSSLQGQLLGLTPDTRPSDQLLGTYVGFQPGPGGTYTATTTTPQGPEDPVELAIVAATRGSVSIIVSVVSPGNDWGETGNVYQSADDLINSIQWPGAQ